MEIDWKETREFPGLELFCILIGVLITQVNNKLSKLIKQSTMHFTESKVDLNYF